MKKLLVAGVAATCLTASGVLAADLPNRRYAPVAPAPVVPIFTWTGLYLGLNAGYGFSTNDDDEVFGDDDLVVGRREGGEGFVGGGQIGYNYQLGQFVVGLETDLQYADLKRDHNDFFDDNRFGYGSQGVEWFGTARGRAGVAFDRALVYATGGFAYGDGGSSSYYDNGQTYSGGDDIKLGYTVGGGVEYAFTNNLSAKVEGLYVGLDHEDSGFAGYSGEKENDFAVVRAGVNYKFW